MSESRRPFRGGCRASRERGRALDLVPWLWVLVMAGGGGANADISKGLSKYAGLRNPKAGSKFSKRVYFGKMITRSPSFIQI